MGRLLKAAVAGSNWPKLRAANVVGWRADCRSASAAGVPGPRCIPTKKKRGGLSRYQLSQDTGDNSTFAFVPGMQSHCGHAGPKQKSPIPRRAKQPE